jgi:hypothetical protein
VRSHFVVIPAPILKRLARVVKALEPLRVQTLVAKAAVERFDVGIVNGLSGTDEVHIDTAAQSVQGQRYDASGIVVGAQFQINTYTISNQREPSVGTDAGGTFVVAWTSNGSLGTDTLGDSVQARIFVPEPHAALMLIGGVGLLSVLYRRHVRGSRSPSIKLSRFAASQHSVARGTASHQSSSGGIRQIETPTSNTAPCRAEIGGC